ncbi:hypothetical protein L9G70_14280 [Morganella morganii]|uniref:hypothetical protein n=1 Tax=Morganella morganii TaxID=582 RepID=UPI0031A5A37D
METIPTGEVGNFYSEGDELLNKPNKEMLPAILSSAKANQKRADHFLRAGAEYGNAGLIIKGHLHNITARALCGVLALYDCDSFELGDVVVGTQDFLDEISDINNFNETIKTIIKFAQLAGNDE